MNDYPRSQPSRRSCAPHEHTTGTLNISTRAVWDFGVMRRVLLCKTCGFKLTVICGAETTLPSELSP